MARAVLLEPRAHLARARLASLAVARGDYEAALPELRRWAEAQPAESAPLLHLATSLLAIEVWGEAADVLDRALTLEPQSAALHRRRGDLCRRMRERERAADHYARAVELDPDDEETRLKLALLLADLGRVDEALAELTDLVRRDPANAEAHFQRGLLLYTERGELEAALASVEKAIALEPDDAAWRMIHKELLLERAAAPDAQGPRP